VERHLFALRPGFFESQVQPPEFLDGRVFGSTTGTYLDGRWSPRCSRRVFPVYAVRYRPRRCRMGTT